MPTHGSDKPNKPKPPPSALPVEKTKVVELGRKTKARREEEMGKRREVKLLEGLEQADPEQKNKRTASININFARPKKKQTKKASTLLGSKKSTTAKTKTSSTPKRRPSATTNNNNNNVDAKVPDVSQVLLQNDEKESLSNVVRVHGIPVATTRGDLIRFFAGLDPQNVFVLPENASHIEGWDAEEIPSSKTKKVVVDRHPPTFRAFVKFVSAPVAGLASQRSGETLYLGKKSTQDASASTQSPLERKGANIAVTQVPKKIAKYLLRNMAVECQGNIPLDKELYQCQEKLHGLVSRILWSAAVQDLKLTLSASTTTTTASLGDDDNTTCYEPIENTESLLADPSQPKGHATLVALHNTLVRDHGTLVKSTPFPSVALWNSPELLNDPIIRLTDTAAKLLKERIQRIDNFLHMARTLMDRQRNGAQNSVFMRFVQTPNVTE